MKLSFLEFGEEGKVIVFLHGWQQDKKSFAPLVQFLFKKYHLFFLDLPGFGVSSPPSENSDSFVYADEVIALLQEKKLMPVILVGHSFGGKVAAIIAEQNPKLVKKVILIASAGIIGEEKHQVLKKVLPAFVKNLLRPYLVGRDYKQAGKLLPIFKTIVREDMTRIFRNIKTPTLIIWGKDDEELPTENGEKINSLIKNSRLEIVEGGHFPFWDNPQEIAELIGNFIDSGLNPE